MSRVKGGPRARKKHKKILKLAKGYRGTRSKTYKRAHEAVLRAGEQSFGGRKQRRRDLRRLWISRINGALSEHDINYSRFIKGMKNAKIDLDRKILADLAITDPEAFKKVVELVKKS